MSNIIDFPAQQAEMIPRALDLMSAAMGRRATVEDLRAFTIYYLPRYIAQNTTIAETTLSRRAKNVCAKENIRTVADLADHWRAERPRKIRGCGVKCAKEIDILLTEYRLGGDAKK